MKNNNERNNFVSILKKVYNVNDKLFLDNTIVNLIYPNFISILKVVAALNAFGSSAFPSK